MHGAGIDGAGPAARQELAAAVVGEGLRPLPAASTPPELQRLLEACWQRDPAARPTASEVVATLSQMQVRLRAPAATPHCLIRRTSTTPSTAWKA